MVQRERKFNENKFYIPSIKKHSKEELEIEQQDLYKDFYEDMNSKKKYLYKFYNRYRKTELKTAVKLVADEKFVVLRLEEDLEKEIVYYLISIFNLNISDRRKYLESLSKKLVDKYCNIYPEEDILRPIMNNMIQSLYYNLVEDYKSTKILNVIIKFFEIEMRLIGCYLKDYIPLKVTKKVNSIVEGCIHILMSSSCDVLGNHLNLVEQTSYLNNEFMKRYEELSCQGGKTCKHRKLTQVIEAIKDIGSPIEEFKHYNELQSKMFRSFKNEKTHCTGANLEFILNFVFKNGYKVKYPHIKINVRNELSDGVMFLLNEYIVTNAIYAILENAIEAKAKEINFSITNNNDTLSIDISNDGETISDTIAKFVFDKGFSTKDGYAGIGLNIAKSWLENVSCKLSYIKGGVFRISILLEKIEGSFN